MTTEAKGLVASMVPPAIAEPLTLADAKTICTGAVSFVTIFAAIAYAAGMFAVHSWLTVYHLQTATFARTGYLLSGIWVLYPVAIAIMGISMVSRTWPLAMSAAIITALAMLFLIFSADLDRFVCEFGVFTVLLYFGGWVAGGLVRYCYSVRDSGKLGIVVFSATMVLFVFSFGFWVAFIEKIPSSLGGKEPRLIRIWRADESVFMGDTEAQRRYYPLALEDDEYFYISLGADTSVAINKQAVHVAEFIERR